MPVNVLQMLVRIVRKHFHTTYGPEEGERRASQLPMTTALGFLPVEYQRYVRRS